MIPGSTPKTKNQKTRTKNIINKSLFRHKPSLWPRVQPWDPKIRSLRENCFILHLFMLNLELLEPVSWQNKVKKLKSKNPQPRTSSRNFNFIFMKLSSVLHLGIICPSLIQMLQASFDMIGFRAFYMVLERLVWKFASGMAVPRFRLFQYFRFI